MQNLTIVFIVGLALLLSLFVVWVQPEAEVPAGYSTLPVSDLTEESATEGETRITVGLQNGDTTTVNDIRPAATELGSGTYEFSGSAPQLEKTYNLTYFETDDYFQINLLAEPLGETRIAAEIALMQQLGISREQLCDLRIMVMTDVYTNQFLAGQELGISSCPGSTAL